MLKRVIAIVIALAAVAVAAFVGAHTMGLMPHSASDAKAVHLPGGYSQLHIGMSEHQVVALLGQPVIQGTNPRFEEKTPAEWASIQSQVDADASQTNNFDSTLSPQDIKLNAQLEHRIKYIWQYHPTPTVDAVLRFDENGNLMRWDYMPELKGPPHGGQSSVKG